MKKLSARMLAARRRREQRHFDRVVAVVGSQSEIARSLVVTPQAVQLWRKDGVPLSRCKELADLTGNVVRPDQLLETYVEQIRKLGGEVL